MSIGVVQRFRDVFRRFTVGWLGDRPGGVTGQTVGFRFLWTMIAPLDVGAEVMLQALQAAWPGQGTATALPLIGQSRGMIRAQAETDAEYAARLVTWLDRARQIGSMLSIARSVHEYLSARPRVRVYNRAGVCLELAHDGTVTTYAAGSTAWNWDSVSNPERAGYWWDLWVCVYPTQWADTGLWGDGRVYGARDAGLGHQVTRVEFDAVLNEIAHNKSAHSHVRAVIWTSDATLFDPTVPASQPDGTWGQWSAMSLGGGSGTRVPSGRNTITCRYWET
jgi:hypothetical protein